MKKKLWIPLAVIVLLLTALWLWYSRPMTFRQLCPGVEQHKLDSMSALWSAQKTQANGKVDTAFSSANFSASDFDIEELFLILDAYTYRRSLKSLLPRGNGVTTFNHRPFSWDLAVGGGASLQLSTVTGILDLRYHDNNNDLSVWCKVSDMEAFEQEVYQLITENAPSE